MCNTHGILSVLFCLTCKTDGISSVLFCQMCNTGGVSSTVLLDVQLRWCALSTVTLVVCPLCFVRCVTLSQLRAFFSFLFCQMCNTDVVSCHAVFTGCVSSLLFCQMCNTGGVSFLLFCQICNTGGVTSLLFCQICNTGGASSRTVFYWWCVLATVLLDV